MNGFLLSSGVSLAGGLSGTTSAATRFHQLAVEFSGVQTSEVLNGKVLWNKGQRQGLHGFGYTKEAVR